MAVADDALGSDAPRASLPTLGPGGSRPRPWAPPVLRAKWGRGRGDLGERAGSQGEVWVRAKGTGALSEARRGGPKGGVAQPRRQGEPELGQLSLSLAGGLRCTLLAAPPTAGERERLLKPSVVGVAVGRGPCLELVRRDASARSGAHSRGLLLPAPVPVAPAVHLAAGAARTRHLRYLILALRLQPRGPPMSSVGLTSPRVRQSQA